MSSLKEEITQDQMKAMKAGRVAELSILRILSAAIKNEEIAKQGELEDVAVQAVISRQVKQLSDALQDFEKGNRADLAEQAQKEIRYLQKYLPAQMNGAEVEVVVKQVIAQNNFQAGQDIGRAMGLVMKELKGKADGNLVRELVEKNLQV